MVELSTDYAQHEAIINLKMCHEILMTRYLFLVNTDIGKGHCTSVAHVMARILTAAFQPRFTNCTSIFVAKASTTASFLLDH